ncbi:selenide, water dikinase SelD [Desulfuribacillus stibiiarsenatis]|uniref:Selenide, water dikinase n=1 Tax=Desulfuribacillus stibiiarsenatis TaxID=1390249 RepID=A0A1E5L4H3_9FIRM|nr:selenide, water dikinase SelD [Desulfuribacillus stibiiarsenatis]
MCHLPPNLEDPNLLVGIDYSDDAGVYRLTDEIALIQTLDYFTPVVDDPYMFGQIAAANALSDVYAMGGKPITAMNIVGFQIKAIGAHVLADILRGGADKVREAGAVIVGGHSIDDAEPKYGLSVTGLCHPKKFWANKGAVAGDVLVLTKPIGVGIITTAIKRGRASQHDIARVSETMAFLNKVASEVFRKYEVHACTDITGFGLLGHSYEMAKASEVSMEIEAAKVPVLENTLTYAAEGIVPGGSKANHEWLNEFVSYAQHIDLPLQHVLCDAITSGGLLLSVTPEAAGQAMQELMEQGIEAAIIGKVLPKTNPCWIEVV